MRHVSPLTLLHGIQQVRVFLKRNKRQVSEDHTLVNAPSSADELQGCGPDVCNLF